VSQNILSKLCIGVIVLLSAIGAFAKDHKSLPFSADSKLTKTGGQEIMTGKLYMAWPKLRLDVKDMQSGFTTFVIIDYVAQKAISVVPQYQTYMELSLDQQNQTVKSTLPIGPNVAASKPCAHTNWSCKKLEPQTIAGRSCEVWEIVSNKSGSITTWVDTKLNFPIKTQSADGYILEYTNIQEGQPAPALFQVPPGYKKSAAHSESKPGR
jgi:hypothetical protein